MRKTIHIAGFFAILLAIGKIVSLCIPPLVEPSTELPERGKRQQKASRFPHFSDKWGQLVYFEVDNQRLARISEEMQREQLRDWLLFALLSDAQLTPREMSHCLYDIPPTRENFTRDIAHFTQGQSRYCYLDSGEVVCLIPRQYAEEGAFWPHLTNIADNARCDLQEIPKTFLIFGYDVDFDKHLAIIRAYGKIPGEDLFADKSAFHQKHIATIQDLRDFLATIDELSSASLDDKGLLLEGRGNSKPQRQIDLEDLSVLWQSLRKRRQKIAEFDSKWQNRADKIAEQWRDIEQYSDDSLDIGLLRMAVRRYLPNSEKIDEWNARELLEALRKQAQQAQQELQQQRQQAWQKSNLMIPPGFSLAPQYDFNAIKKAFAKVVEYCRQQKLQEANWFSPERVAKIDDGLAAKDIAPFLAFAEEMAEESFVLHEVLRHVTARHQRLVAHYHGHLQGTQVGMELFYTDLFGKMWGTHFISPPQIDGAGEMPTIHSPELSSSYLHFAPDKRKFQATEAKRLYLSPMAVQVDASNRNLALWWDRNYRQIAQLDPSYDKLNQLLKWSLLFSWLESNSSSDNHEFLSHLAKSKVTRNHWFPEWVKNTPLRFKQWQQIPFSPRNNSHSHEIIAFTRKGVVDQRGKIATVSGGVTLATPALFRNSFQPLPPPSIRRADNLYSVVEHQQLVENSRGTQYHWQSSSPDQCDILAASKKSQYRYRITHQKQWQFALYTSDDKTFQLDIVQSKNHFRIQIRHHDDLSPSPLATAKWLDNFAGKPEQLAQFIDEQFAKAAKDLYKLLINAPIRALHKAEDLQQIYGKRPELSLVQAIVRIHRQWPTNLSTTMDDNPVFIRDREAFLTQIVASIKTCNTADQAKNIAQVANYYLFQDFCARYPKFPGKGVLVERDAHIEFHYHSAELPMQRVEDISQFTANNSLLYVEDTISLQQLDWNAPETLAKIHDKKTATITLANIPQIKQFRPAIIFIGERRLRQVTSSKTPYHRHFEWLKEGKNTVMEILAVTSP